MDLLTRECFGHVTVLASSGSCSLPQSNLWFGYFQSRASLKPDHGDPGAKCPSRTMPAAHVLSSADPCAALEMLQPARDGAPTALCGLLQMAAPLFAELAGAPLSQFQKQ